MAEATGERGEPDVITVLAARHGFGEEAARALAAALAAGNGTMAQFSHPELGGMGQWSAGGMLMIGDMFNADLKTRVGALAADLAEAVKHGAACAPPAGPGAPPPRVPDAWWPADLGQPSASGAQNGARYAVFAQARRLAVERDGRITLHDTGEHRITGASQAQGATSTLRFTSQHGGVDLGDLPAVRGAS